MFVERYDNGINGNFLILENGQAVNAGYKSRMLVENPINAFLKTGIVHTDGKEQYVYDITSKTSIYSLYEHTEMDRRFIGAFISAIACGLEACDEYLLPVEHLMFDPKHIYVDQSNDRILFCYYPASCTTLYEGMNGLAEYILERADHTDKAATTLAYDLYKQVVNEDYTLRELLSRNEETEAAKAGEDSEEDSFLIEDINDLYLPDEDDMPVIPAQGKVIMIVCSVLLLIVTGTILTSVIYDNETLTALLAMTEMRVLTAITCAVCILMPVLIIIKWYGSVRRFKKLLNEAEGDRDDIYMYMTGNIQTTAAGRTGSDRTDTVLLTQENITVAEDGHLGNTVRLTEDPEPESNSASNTHGMIHRLVQFSQRGLNELKIDRLPYTIGKKRGVCDGIIESDAVSRIHARLLFEGGEYYMSDLNSTNGTFVNGSRLRSGDKIRLNINDEISFGKELFYFR